MIEKFKFASLFILVFLSATNRSLLKRITAYKHTRPLLPDLPPNSEVSITSAFCQNDHQCCHLCFVCPEKRGNNDVALYIKAILKGICRGCSDTEHSQIEIFTVVMTFDTRDSVL